MVGDQDKKLKDQDKKLTSINTKAEKTHNNVKELVTHLEKVNYV